MNRWQLWVQDVAGPPDLGSGSGGADFLVCLRPAELQRRRLRHGRRHGLLSAERHGPAHQPAQWLPGSRMVCSVSAPWSPRVQDAMMTVATDVTPNPAFASFTRSASRSVREICSENTALGPAIVATGKGPVYRSPPQEPASIRNGNVKSSTCQLASTKDAAASVGSHDQDIATRFANIRPREVKPRRPCLSLD